MYTVNNDSVYYKSSVRNNESSLDDLQLNLRFFGRQK